MCSKNQIFSCRLFRLNNLMRLSKIQVFFKCYCEKENLLVFGKISPDVSVSCGNPMWTAIKKRKKAPGVIVVS